MIWDLHQEMRIYQVDKAAIRADSQAHEATRYVRHLEAKVDRLALICRAMWEVLRENDNLTEEDLLKKVEEVDLLDGKLDGKVTIAPKKCSSCGRQMAPKHTRCLYCGEEKLLDSAFDSMS